MSKPKGFSRSKPNKQKPLVMSSLRAKTENQKKYLNSINVNTVTIGYGPAGVGKTYLCSHAALQSLSTRKCKRIIISRPCVETGESMGFLPGSIEEKFDPYLLPIKNCLDSFVGSGQVDGLIASGSIIITPLAYMRGLTFDDAFVILDEAQNATCAQLKMFMSRLGEHSTVVINGDVTQSDLVEETGLAQICRMFNGKSWLGKINFDIGDIVRSGVAKEVVIAYIQEEERRLAKNGFGPSHTPSFMV